MKLTEDLPKEKVLELVDGAGSLLFTCWYKQTLTYTNDEYTVVISPEYRDQLSASMSLEGLLQCEDYFWVSVYKGLEKPYKEEWFREGGNL